MKSSLVRPRQRRRPEILRRVRQPSLTPASGVTAPRGRASVTTLKMWLAAAILLGCAALDRFIAPSSADDLSTGFAVAEVAQLLGHGVIEDAQLAGSMLDPGALARWEAGAWKYRITAGARRGQTEIETLAPVGLTARGETWERTVGREYTLYLRRTAEGSVVMPTEIAHEHKALVHFEPPLSYLIADLAPGDGQTFDGKMEVYNARAPATRWYSGRIQAKTTYAGVYRIATPAGTYSATLITTEYRIEILKVVSVWDTLYTFYAGGVGKVAEAEHRRVSAVGLFSSDTKFGKVLLSFTPAPAPPGIEAP
jgi:hypothetical protein